MNLSRHIAALSLLLGNNSGIKIIGTSPNIYLNYGTGTGIAIRKPVYLSAAIGASAVIVPTEVPIEME